jgi:hypothetical protein
MRSGALQGLAPIVCAFGLACGGGAKTQASATDPADTSAAMERLDAVVCQRMGECMPAWLAQSYGDQATCVSRMDMSMRPLLSLRATAWTVDVLDQCTEGIRTQTCDDRVNGVVAPGCAFTGLRELDQPCVSHAQCKTGYCSSHDAGLCGACAAPPGKGVSCTWSSDCASPNWCMPDYSCAPPGGLGAACDENRLCGSMLNCVSAKCTARGTTVGAYCDTSNGVSCEWLQHGVDCYKSLSKCVGEAWASAGQACGQGATLLTYCSAGGPCMPNASGTGNVCQAGPKDGEACEDSYGHRCMWPAECMAGVCKIWDAQPACDAI